MSLTQQESNRQKRLERRRQHDRDKHARETPDERNRRRGLFNARSYYFVRAYASLASQPYFSSVRSPAPFPPLMRTRKNTAGLRD